MLLLLVVDGHLAGGVLQADGDLAVVRDALRRALVVFVEAHLVVVDDAVHVMPGSEETHTHEHIWINPSGETNPDAPA